VINMKKIIGSQESIEPRAQRRSPSIQARLDAQLKKLPQVNELLDKIRYARTIDEVMKLRRSAVGLLKAQNPQTLEMANELEKILETKRKEFGL
jgi:hypothetical protein